MPKIIRIGTRDSELALWQAKAVQQQLEHLGHATQIIPLKSDGDLILDKPIYEMGTTGVFTKVIDVALLNKHIDIAVHSLKDVPTALPKGIVQAAVLKRGNVKDVLVFKNNEEFLSQKDAIIATGSLRRKAQWLNRYPTHNVVTLRGNVNTRLQKLKDNNWNGAVFAAAGLGRIGLTPAETVSLDWMVPAPAQGAVVITALLEDEETRAICREINHEETEICTTIERQFLRLLEGGCSAPIGALAYIKNEEVHFHGVLLSLDGTKKIEVKRFETLGRHHQIAKYCADYVIERGGKRLMDQLKLTKKQSQIYSTKTLTEAQRQVFKDTIVVDDSDFIKISTNRIPLTLLKSKIENVIITSQNAVESIITNCPKEDLQFKNIYCVGRRTKKLIESKIGKVKHSENSAEKLANYLVEFIDGTEVTYFCSAIRLDELPTILEKNHIKVNEIEAYETVLDPVKVDTKIEGVMFYSPSTVQSYIQLNKADKIAYCIGKTTATEAKMHFKEVRVAKIPTIESVIDLINENYK
ncbi:hydroxymethylbilane synthase [Flavobacteriaceae bacterium LMO-SS05]|jgi:hydroxymethylbilane synthase